MSERAAIVTGGSSGIGFAIARMLLEEGYGIIVVARRCPVRESTFWTLIAHDLYPETLDHMADSPTSQAEPHS